MEPDFDNTNGRRIDADGIEPNTTDNSFWGPYERRVAAGEAAKDASSAENPADPDDEYEDDEYEDYDPEAEDSMTRRERSAAARELYREQRRKSRRKIPFLLKLLIWAVAVVGVSVTAASVGWMAAGDVLALNKDYVTATVTITEDTTVDDIAAELADDQIIEYPNLFLLYCSFTNAEEKLDSVGDFTVNTNMDYHALISAMTTVSSSRKEIQVTIPEGYTVDQIFQLLVDKGVCEDITELQEIAAEHDYNFEFLKDIPLGDYHRLEGYLFPDTYTFYIGHDPLYAINKMLVNFDNQFTSEMRSEANAMGYSVYEVLTVASIIEKESNGQDQRNIASVIYNRLSDNTTLGLLQMDSTIQYALERAGEERKEDLTDADLAIDSVYNTYTHAGLPAGPICNPSLMSIQAALNPNSTDYYYYLHDGYGNSYFFSDSASFQQGIDVYLDENYVADDDVNYEDVEDIG